MLHIVSGIPFLVSQTSLWSISNVCFFCQEPLNIEHLVQQMYKVQCTMHRIPGAASQRTDMHGQECLV